MNLADKIIPSRWKKLPIVIGGILSGTLLIGGLTLHLVEHQLMETTGQTLALAAGSVADQLDRIVFERRGDTLMMARAFSGRCHDIPYMGAYLNWVQHAYPLYESLSVLDAQGRVITSTSAALAGKDFGAQPWFAQIRDGQGAGVHQWESLRLSAQEEAAGVSFAAIIRDANGTACGAVMSRMGLTILGEVVTRMWSSSETHQPPFPALEYQIVTRTGLPFVDSLHPADAASVNLRELSVPSFLRAESEPVGHLEETHVRRHLPIVTGFARTHGFRDSPNPNWTVLLRIDRSTLLAPIQSHVELVGMLGLIAMAPLTVGLVWTARRLRKVGHVPQSERARTGAAESAFHEALRRHHELVTAIDGIARECEGRTWRVTSISTRVEALLGFPVSRWLNEPDFLERHLHPDDRQRVLASYAQAAQERCGYLIEYRMIAADGRLVWLQNIVAVIVDDHGPSLLQGTMVDITERKRAEDAHTLLAAIVESSDDAIVSMDLAGTIVSWNQGAERLFGYASEEMLGQPMTVLIPMEQREEQTRILADLEREKRIAQFETIRQRKDGTRVPVSISASPIRAEDGAILGAATMIRNITERKQAEEQFRLVLEAAPNGVLLVNETGQIALVNAQIEQLFGYPRQELLGQPIEQLIPDRLRSDHPHHRQAFAQAPTHRAMGAGRDLYGRRKDGSEFPIEIGLNPLALPQGRHILASIIDITERKQAEETLRKAHAELEQRVQDRTAALTQANTALREQIVKREHVEQQLIQAQKMEAIGRLAGGIAHDFNNLLTGINGNAELLLKQLEPWSPFYTRVETIRHTGERAAKITSQLLAFSRQQIIQPETLAINGVVQKMAEFLPPLIGEQIQLICKLDPAAGCVTADPGQFDQILLNLTTNARDAMPHGGTITIETIAIGGPTPSVQVVVRDTGIGMTKDTQARIFEPFFTTKDFGKGTGLGLSIVYGIVTQNGGTIAVESAPGRGTAFTLTFPRVDPAIVETVAPDGKGDATTILLVEDDAVVRELAKEMLLMQGYHVVEAAHGAEALQLSTAIESSIHLLLTDVMMPGMNGHELATHILAQRPDTLVVFMSGHHENARLRQGIASQAISFLPKPFTANELLSIVSRTLEARSTGEGTPAANHSKNTGGA